MTKLMEVLKKREAPELPAPKTVTAPAPVSEVSCCCAGTTDQPEEAFPYIEIDGATRTLAGSADVLTAPVPLARAKTVERATGVRPDSAAPLVYQPWPGILAADPARLAPELVVFHDPEGAGSRPYLHLLEQLLQAERPPQVLLFTSRNQDTRLTIPVLNLAIAACQQKHRKVVVLGREGKQPSVTSCLGLPPAPELQQVLEGRIALEQALQTSPVANLTALAIGSSQSAAVWSRDALRWVMSWLRGRFNLVFLDVGSWQATPEQVLLANLCDAVYAILQGTENRQAEVQPFLQSIAAQGGPVRGLINVQPAA